MKRFADTFYFLALLNPKASAHAVALAHSSGANTIVTTEWILTEIADALALHTTRQSFLNLYQILRAGLDVQIVPASAELFARGVEFYGGRPDKDWSLTDCISFLVMVDYGITEALTGDHHFEQAGFRALLEQEKGG